MIAARLTRSTAGAAVAAWLVAVAAGLAALRAHEATPGRVAEPSGPGPMAAGLGLDPARAHLVLVAHPRCPCTRASLGELARIVAECPGAATPHVLFTVPRGSRADWRATDHWRLAAEIPGARVVADEDGAMAGRLGAATSGHVVVFGPGGRALYSGGITGARGHHGDNDGHDAVAAILRGRAGGPSRAPVYGCPVVDGRARGVPSERRR